MGSEMCIRDRYKGFIRLYNVADVNIQDCELFSHKYKEKSNYDLFIEYATNTKITNVTSNDIEDTERWGIVGTHYTKDTIYENCKLNRFDSHRGAYNITINNCTVGTKGITVIGSGNLTISNSTILSNDYLIELRSDYGSTWQGNIYINNCTYKPSNANQLIYFKASYDNDVVHDFGYDLYLPNIFIDNLIIDDKDSMYNKDNLYIYYNNQYYVGNSDGNITEIYNLPQKVYIKSYQTTSGRKIKLFYQKFYDNIEDIGIDLSIPLTDKQEIQIMEQNNKEIQDNIITSQSIIVNYQDIEGIETVLKINDKKQKEQKVELSKDGKYYIVIQYQNAIGELESESRTIIIDKTSPVITGIEEGKTYLTTNKVKPQITDDNLKEVKLLLNGQVVNNYVANSVIQEEGIYQLIATDKAGNETVVRFQIREPKDEDYKIEDKQIRNIDGSTKKTDFQKKLLLNEEYSILRNNKEIADDENIATGDVLKTKSGKEYILIITGDINKDGVVNIKDIINLRKYILLGNNLDNTELIAADTNLDGKEINIKDLVKMRIIVLNNEE